MNEITDNSPGEEPIQQMREVFKMSRTGVILRCAEFMIDSGRKDLAKKILLSKGIGREQIAELKAREGIQ